MTQIILDDRPIKPNRQYLLEKQREYKEKNKVYQFLKKNNSDNKVLPCFKENLNVKNKKKQIHLKQKTKAEIYEEIKQKNKQKFGELKKDQQKIRKKQEKKLNPKNMTIQYKPKKQIKIDTYQYKRYGPRQSGVKSNELKSQNAKEKYQKLLQIIIKQKQQLTKQKQNIQKHKDFIDFKKYVQKQSVIVFQEEAKKNIRMEKLRNSMKKKCLKSSQQNQQEQNCKKKKVENKKQTKQRPNINMTDTISKIIQLQQQKEQIEDQIVYENNTFMSSDQVMCKRYSITRLNQIPAFDIENIKEFLDLNTLYPERNQFYLTAINVIEIGLSNKQSKKDFKSIFVEQNEAVEKQTNTVNYKRKYQGSIRITKYNNGWVEVWNPGKQRLMSNSELHYKVVWLKNGDIKQEWSDKKVISYFCKEKEIVQISLDKLEPVYFFTRLNQLQKYNRQGKVATKTIMFKDGSIEQIIINDSECNPFAI